MRQSFPSDKILLRFLLLTLITATLTLAARVDAESQRRLVVYFASADQAPAREAITFFTKLSPIEVKVIEGSAGELPEMVKDSSNTMADIFMTDDLFSLIELNRTDFFERYESVATSSIPEPFRGEGKTWMAINVKADTSVDHQSRFSGIDGVAILKDAPNITEAQKFMDFIASPATQALMSGRPDIFPLHPKVQGFQNVSEILTCISETSLKECLNSFLISSGKEPAPDGK